MLLQLHGCQGKLTLKCMHACMCAQAVIPAYTGHVQCKDCDLPCATKGTTLCKGFTDLEGGSSHAFLVLYNEGMAYTNVEPEVCSVKA